MKNSKKKKMPLLLKIFLVIIGLIAALILAGFVWLRVNQEKIFHRCSDSCRVCLASGQSGKDFK